MSLISTNLNPMQLLSCLLQEKKKKEIRIESKNNF